MRATEALRPVDFDMIRVEAYIAGVPPVEPVPVGTSTVGAAGVAGGVGAEAA